MLDRTNPHNYLLPENYQINATATDQDGTYTATPIALAVGAQSDIRILAPNVTQAEGSALGIVGKGLPILMDSAYPLKEMSFMYWSTKTGRFNFSIFKVNWRHAIVSSM
jgi:hypothetical protein